MSLFEIIIGTILQNAPTLIQGIKDAAQKQGYTNEQIDAVFSAVTPPDQLGINPNHPDAPEPAPTPASVATPPPAPAGVAAPSEPGFAPLVLPGSAPNKVTPPPEPAAAPVPPHIFAR